MAARPTAPFEGRRFIAEQCVRLGMLDLTDTAQLLASELVTNAVIHTGSDPTVAVASTCGQLVVEVRDADKAWPAPPGDPTSERGDAPGGRGLTLVAHLADEWGVRAIDGDGKGIWFSLRPTQPPPYAERCGCASPMYDAFAES